jgi:imidazolonepropionase-like amidohydrolase
MKLSPLFLLVATSLFAQQPDPMIAVNAPVVALTHARVIDGRGRAPLENQTLILRDGKIAALGADLKIPDGATVLDLTGKTVLPGLVMLHEHLYFTSVASPTTPRHFGEMEYSAPRLYLACGVTTARTGGSLEP